MPKGSNLPKEEWNFSPLFSATAEDQRFAHDWEWTRELGRTSGNTNLPPPWLSIPATRRGSVMEQFWGHRVTNRPAIIELKSGQEHWGTIPINSHRLAIDWSRSNKEIVASFSELIRKKRPQLGRRDTHISALWDLSIYRLRSLEKMTPAQVVSLFSEAQFSELQLRRRKLVKTGSAQEISAALSRARKHLDENSHHETKVLQRRFLRGRMENFQVDAASISLLNVTLLNMNAACR